MTIRSFKQLPPGGRGTPREMADVVRLAMNGKTNNTGEVTLTANSATTVVTDLRVSGESTIFFMPLTANAAEAFMQVDSPMYVSSLGDGTFTITHVNNAETDRDFKYVVIG